MSETPSHLSPETSSAEAPPVDGVLADLAKAIEHGDARGAIDGFDGLVEAMAMDHSRELNRPEPNQDLLEELYGQISLMEDMSMVLKERLMLGDAQQVLDDISHVVFDLQLESDAES